LKRRSRVGLHDRFWPERLASWGIPAGFDSEGFLTAAKNNFVTLQVAWDKADIGALRSMMTDAMLVEIQSQLSERESHPGTTPNRDRRGHDGSTFAGH
jgi:predicted lipid-binding transport protein (Tim44 family)